IRPCCTGSLVIAVLVVYCFCVFFFHDPATTEIYTLSLHDALPIYGGVDDEASAVVGVDAADADGGGRALEGGVGDRQGGGGGGADRKSTRLNSSHVKISYAVFCLKKKKETKEQYPASGGVLVSSDV